MPGEARLGEARRGLARRGLARRGKVDHMDENMCDKQHERDLAWLKAEGERFRKELGKGEDGKYPEIAGWIKRVKRDPKSTTPP